MTHTSIHGRFIAMAMIYVVLKFFGGSFGQMVLYPITLFVTFLHEFGHALGAIITGGAVEGLQINTDGSGYTITRGGNQAIVLMGGYLGSAFLGNLLLYIGAKARNITQGTLITLAVLMTIAAIFWHESFISTGILLAFAFALYFVATKTNWDRDVLMFLGLAAVFYIIQDFNVGPKSDLAMYEQTVGIFSAQTWMILWLVLAGLMSAFNVKEVLRR
jgi:Peptidase M50B-like